MNILATIETMVRDPLSCGIDDIERLLGSPAESHQDIFSAADGVNRILNADRVSYIVNRNVNFTDQCTLGCAFCGFSKRPDDPASFMLDIDGVLQRIAETPFIDEVCIQGGISPNVSPSFYFDLIAEIRRSYPSVSIHAFSPQEIFSLAERCGASTADTLARLLEAGLGSMPGTAAEILNEHTRRRIAPNKIDSTTWERIISEAHREGIRTTATMMFGHIETDRDIADHLARLRRIQTTTSGLTEFVPLPFIPDLTPLARRCGPPMRTSRDLVRLVYAVSRLYFGATIRNIQTSWVKLGADEAAFTLGLGVNDFGGTLYEENITKRAGGIHGELLTEDQIVRQILAAGKRPARRTTTYQERVVV